MRFKSYLICSFIACMLIGPFGLQSVQSAEDPSNYYSVHQEPVTGIHCTTGECSSGENCAYSANCPSEKPYLRNVARVGYREINELRNDYFSIGSTVSLPAVTCTNQSGIAANKSQRFRLYVPAGTTELDLTLFCTQEPLAVVARWKQAPDAAYVNSITSFSSYTSFAYFDAETSYNLDTMAARDVYLQNPGGTLRVYSGVTGSTSVQEGGWLYVYAFYYSTTTPPIVRIINSIEANTDKFYTWFDETTAQNGWNSVGDPLLPGAAADTCSTNPTLCQSESECGAAGYNWCDEACQIAACDTQPVCTTPEACLTQADCLQSGFNWCDGLCQTDTCGTGTCSQEDLDNSYQSGLIDAQVDSDGDGVIDLLDECAQTVYGSYVDPKGCAMPFEDYNFAAFNAFGEEPTLNIPKLYVGFGFYKVTLKLIPDTNPLKFVLDNYEYMSSDDDATIE